MIVSKLKVCPIVGIIVLIPCLCLAERYGLLVGIDNYAPGYASSLYGCVNDVYAFRERLLSDSASRWASSNITVLTDSLATKSNIRAQLNFLADRAVAGDVIVYFHSSHGGSNGGYDTYLCSYNSDYNDYELASDLALFVDGVKVIIVVDACYSGGLFKSTETRFASGWNLADNVMRKLNLMKTAMGIKSTWADIGWITACDYDETSWSDDPNSLFAGYLLGGFFSGDSNADGEISFLELFNYAAPRTISDNYQQDAQTYNTAILSEVYAATAASIVSLNEALGSNFVWETGGDANWQGQNLVSHDGSASVMSGDIGNNQTSWLQTTINGPGTLSFWWKVSCEKNYDYLRFYVDNSRYKSITGGTEWQYVSVVLTSGTHTLKWVYEKDMLESSGIDAGWIDEIRWQQLMLRKLFWQSAQGQVVYWDLDTNGVRNSWGSTFSSATSWRVSGVGDMDVDGIGDLVWQYPSTGQVVVWYMNPDGTRKGTATFINSTSWQVKAVGDLDGDGIGDWVWQYPSTGKAVVWYMNSDGTWKTYRTIMGSTTWQVKSAGDLDGDGIADLFWQYPSTGKAVVWYMNPDGTRKGTATFINSTSWQVKAVGDLDGDGIGDIFWQYPGSSVVVWYMNPDGTRKSYTTILSGSTSWNVVGLSD